MTATRTNTAKKNEKRLEQLAIGEALVPLLHLAIDTTTPLLLTGHSGIGKSQFVHDQAAALGRRVAVLNMALFESAAELLGLPVIEDGRTVYATPTMLPDGEGWIVLIEEAARAAPHVMAAFYEFLTSRRIGDYELPADCAIIACMNPPGPDYDGQEFDRAMADRFMHVEVVANRDEWLPWAAGAGVHEAILDTVREDLRLFRLASPRSWYRASKLLQAAQARDLDRSLIEHVLAAELRSTEAAHAVARYLDGVGEDRPIAPADVLNHYARDPRICRRVRKLLRTGRTDAIEKLVFGVEELLSGDALAGLLAAGGFELAALEKFAGDIPGDRAAALLRTFATNPASGATLDVDAEHALLSYGHSPLAAVVARWRKSNRGHRLRALAHRVVAHLDDLDSRGRLAKIRRAPPVRDSLGTLCEQLAEHGDPLRAALARLDLEPPNEAEAE